MSASNLVLRPLTVGIVGGLAADYWIGLDLRIGQSTVPMWAAAGAAVAVGSAIAGLSNNYLLSMIPQSETLKNIESAALAVGANAAGTAASLYVLNPGSVQDIGLMKIVGVAALAEVAGGYLYDMVIRPMAAPSE